MIINDLDGYYIVFDTKNWNTELDTLIINERLNYRSKSFCMIFCTIAEIFICSDLPMKLLT